MKSNRNKYYYILDSNNTNYWVIHTEELNLTPSRYKKKMKKAGNEKRFVLAYGIAHRMLSCNRWCDFHWFWFISAQTQIHWHTKRAKEIDKMENEEIKLKNLIVLSVSYVLYLLAYVEFCVNATYQNKFSLKSHFVHIIHIYYTTYVYVIEYLRTNTFIHTQVYDSLDFH